MVDESRTSICVLGGGPMGIETALYGRYLGYDVSLIEAGDIAANVRRRGHVEMHTPFRTVRSTLGLAALGAQNAEFAAPDDAALLTGSQWVERYLVPLTETDLLADCCATHTRVTAVKRLDSNSDFRLTVECDSSGAREVTANIVVDCTGTCGELLVDSSCEAAGGARCDGKTNEDIPGCSGHDSTLPASSALFSPAANFFVLGSKTINTEAGSAAGIDFDQIQALFRRIVGREGLDLYATAATLL